MWPLPMKTTVFRNILILSNFHCVFAAKSRYFHIFHIHVMPSTFELSEAIKKRTRSQVFFFFFFWQLSRKINFTRERCSILMDSPAQEPGGRSAQSKIRPTLCDSMTDWLSWAAFFVCSVSKCFLIFLSDSHTPSPRSHDRKWLSWRPTVVLALQVSTQASAACGVTPSQRRLRSNGLTTVALMMPPPPKKWPFQVLCF